MQPLDRRGFLGLSLGALAGARALPGWLGSAARGLPPGGRRLVVLELFGGNDGLNTLAPVGDDRYHRARPTIALKPADVLPVDEVNGLHGALVRTRAWLDEGRVALVRGVGYPQPNLSHFASRDVWSTASTRPVRRDAGWLGRWAEGQPTGELALLSLGSDAAPRLVRGPTRRAPAVPDLGGFRFDAGRGREARARRAAFTTLSRLPGADAEVGYVQAALELARETSATLSRAARGRRPVVYPGTRLGRDLAAAADVIAADLPTRVLHVQLDGFDTHTRQLGAHAGLLGQLDAALDAFLRDLRALGRLDDTLVMTISEFGRRVAENGVGDEAGTDHGTASLQLLAGGRVRAGLHGPQPDLERLDADGNLLHAVDFRSVLATVLSRWLEADAALLRDGPWPTLPLLEVS